MGPVPPAHVVLAVTYSGPIRDALGISGEQVGHRAGETVRAVVHELERRHGATFGDALLAGAGQLVPNAIVLLDGRDIRHGDGLETRVERPGELVILLMPAAAGGG
jgi:molybdopterin converting factor small subunit